MASLLKNQKIDVVITSDLLRARHTAEHIAEITGAQLIVDKNLRGRDIGIAQGMHHRERRQLYGDIFATYENVPPGGESFKNFEERVTIHFRQHHATYRRKNVVLVTHIETIHAILKHTKRWDFKEMLARQSETTSMLQFDVADPCLKCKNDLYEQDPDVFDTWFSSGQWPFATLLASQGTSGKKQGISEITNYRLPITKSKDFQTFYPTSVMETGHDILFFWVARMIMLGLYRTGEIPFRNIYLHGLVRDKDRQKMSKSKGNVIDPLGVAELYGTDAVRMALVMGNTPGNDIIISEDKIRGYRNFATKVWNIARFVLINRARDKETSSKSKAQRLTLSATDKKFLAEAKKVKTNVSKHIEKFEFHRAAEETYHYIWHTFADTVIEHYKPKLQKVTLSPEIQNHQKITKADHARADTAREVLKSILNDCLIMLHPLMPFLTEAIYDHLHPEELLMTHPWK